MASSAVKTSVDVNAKMILVMSETGKMASYVSKFRPGRAAMCLTPYQTVARQLSGLLLGMHTIVVDSLEKSEELIQEVSYELIESGMLKIGDTVVIVAGRMAGMKEKMEVISLGRGQKFGHIVPNSAGFFFNRELILAYSEHGSPMKKLSSSVSLTDK
jgi:pyruvate kinase